MAQYLYKGKDKSGKAQKGAIFARSKTSAYEALKNKGVVAFSLTEKVEKQQHYKLKSRELADFSRQMSTMLSSGISIIKATSILRQRSESKKMRTVMDTLYENLQSGNVLSDSMEKCGGSFPDFIVNMFRAGEKGGILEATAMKAAQYYEKEFKQQTALRNAMVYPIILAVVTTIVTLFIFTFILPQFKDIFGDMKLPFMTKVIMGCSEFLIHHFIFILLVLVLLVAVFLALLKKPAVARELDRCKIKIPKIGNLLKIVYTARFARTLSILYGTGISMVEAVGQSSLVIGNRYIESLFFQVIKSIREGNSLSQSIVALNAYLDKKLVSSIYIGEETGKLEEVLASISDGLDYEADMASAKLMAMVEPLMIIILAVIIGTIILSVVVPMLNMYSQI